MAKTAIYGIKNCDTMKKALKWLDDQNIDVTFHDYKKQGTDEEILDVALKQCGWENVINRRGTTWRKLPKDTQKTMNEKDALTIASENPSIIKRPLLVYEEKIYLGFNEDEYKSIFSIEK